MRIMSSCSRHPNPTSLSSFLKELDDEWKNVKAKRRSQLKIDDKGARPLLFLLSHAAVTLRFLASVAILPHLLQINGAIIALIERIVVGSDAL